MNLTFGRVSVLLPLRGKNELKKGKPNVLTYRHGDQMPTLPKHTVWEGRRMLLDKGTDHKITVCKGSLGAVEFKF